MQRRHRDLIVVDRAQVAVLRRRGFAAAQSDPVIGAAGARPCAARSRWIAGHIGPAAPDLYALHLGRGAAGKIDIDQRASGPARLHQAADQIGAMRFARRPVDVLARSSSSPACDRAMDGNAQRTAFHRAGDGAGIGDIIRQIGTPIDSRQDQFGRLILQNMQTAPSSRNRWACR